MTLDKRIERTIRKVDALMIEFAKKVPDKNLPLVNLEGLSNDARLIIETRLKGEHK
jgi:hypothetical protein